MKKFLASLLVFCMIFCLAACKSENSTDTDISDNISQSKTTDSQAEESVILETENETESKDTTSTIEPTQKPVETKKPTTNEPQTEKEEPKEETKEEPPKETNVNPTITASSTSVSLNNSSESVTITVTGLDEWSTTYDIANSEIVDCAWGEWNGGNCTLTFTPLKAGNTTVTVFLDDYNKKVTINISAHIPTLADQTSLTINGVGQEFELYYSANNISISEILSADYQIKEYGFGDQNCINIIITTLVQMKQYNGTSGDHIGIDYELFDDRNVCIRSGHIWQEVDRLYQPYSVTINFWDLGPGDYTLVFSNMMM